MRRLSRFTQAAAILAVLLACTEGTAPGSLGQLRVHPVFSPGEEPATLGVSPSEIRLVLRRADGALVADTSLPYIAGDTTSWLIDLNSPPENVGITADLGQGAAKMYSGSGQVSLSEGIGPSSTQHDLPVRYLSGPSFTIDVSPDSAGLESGGATRQFAAVARDAGGAALTGFSFTWASSQPGVATVNPATGLVTAVAPGRSEITASSGGVTGTAVVTVAPLAPVSIVVTPDSGVLAPGGTLQFTAVLRDALGNVVQGVTTAWSSSRIDVATVSASGVATALGTGETFIIARFGSLADTSKLVVMGIGTPDIVSIVVTPPNATLNATGATQQFIAIALDAQGIPIPGVAFQWSSSNAGVAPVNGAGLATAVAAGVTAITASAHGVTGSASLTVSTNLTGPPAVIIIIPAVWTLNAPGATVPYSAFAIDAQGRFVPNMTFAWTSSEPAVASIHPTGGLATAVSPGVTIISASAAGLIGSATLTVAQVVHSISVSPPTATVVAGNSTTYTAEARDANGHIIAGAVFAWSTADPSIATAGVGGVVTGVSGGNTEVWASAGGVTGVANVNVAVVGSVQIQGDIEQSVEVGQTRQLTAVVRDTAGNVLTGVQVTWSTSAPALASINQTGLLTGLSPGVTRVRAAVGTVFHEIGVRIYP